MPPMCVRGVEEVKLTPNEVALLGLFWLRGARLLGMNMGDGSGSPDEGAVSV